MRKAYVVAAKRSAIGNPMGGLTNVSLVDLGAAVLNKTIEEVGTDPANTDEVVVEDAIAASLDQNIGCQISVRAGAPVKVYAQSLNMLCGSGLRAVMETTMRAQRGSGGAFVAGGVESITDTLYLMPNKMRSSVKIGNARMMNFMLYDGLIDGMYGTHMDVIADSTAKKYSISHEDQDALAYASQQRAIAAIDPGRSQDEIVPVGVSDRKGGVTVFDTDEHPSRVSAPEKLAKLRPAFIRDNTVTAGNASDIDGGASLTVIVSKDAVKKHNLTPLTGAIGISRGGVNPRTMGLDSTPTTLHALKYADLCIKDIELVELNGMFTTQSLGIVHKLKEATGMDRNAFIEKIDINGGAIAPGHPVGTSGSRILVSLLREMQERDLKIGLTSLCIGGGQGATIIIKRV